MGMVTDSFVRATHYVEDVKEVDQSEWAKYRWDSRRPSETAYMLVIGPPCAFCSKAVYGRNLEERRSDLIQKWILLASIMEPRLVIIEDVKSVSEQESWQRLEESVKAIGYCLAHEEIMVHSELGGATDRKRTFIWFQRSSEGCRLPFPRVKQPSLFEGPHMVIRDVLTRVGHSTNPWSLNSNHVFHWMSSLMFLVGEPAHIGNIRWGDYASCPNVEPGVRGHLVHETGVWSVLRMDLSGQTTFLNCDRLGTRSVCNSPISDFTRKSEGADYQVYSSDGIAPAMEAEEAYPERASCLIWQPKKSGNGGRVRCLSVEEKWSIQQLDPADLHMLKLLYVKKTV